MMGGLLWSRGLLSTSIIVFIVVCIVFYGRTGWRMVKSSNWLIGMILLFIIPAITWGWSEDHYQWSRIVQTKIPLLLFPFCCAALMHIPKQVHKILFAVWVVFCLMATMYTYWSLFSGNYAADEYLKAKVLPVAMGNDHVRFSWLLLVMCIFLVDGWMMEKKGKMKWLYVGLLAWFAIYFHVLAAKTGLVGFYIICAIAIAKYGQRKYLFPVIAGIVCIPIFAWSLIPSFRNRVKFVVWDYQNYSRGNYTEGLSDGPRILSFRAGLDIVKNYPVAGTGAGDVLHDTEQWYAEHADYLKPYERLLPSNQILVYACAAGILGGLASICIFLYPFFMRREWHYLSWISFHAIAIMVFLYEIGLEVQYGVFIFGFYGIWLYARIKSDLHQTKNIV